MDSSPTHETNLYTASSLDNGLMFATLNAAQLDQYSFSSLPFPEHQYDQPTNVVGTIYEPSPFIYESEDGEDELARGDRATMCQSEFMPSHSVTGGRAAAAKKITADLDLTDQIISRMKAEGYRDAHIRDHLVRLGLESYNEKTISTRNIRIRRVLLAKETAILDEEENDWAQQDDEHLIAAVEALSESHNREVAALETKHWVEIAQKKQQLDHDARHSSNGCKRRYNALSNGTARIPYDIDPDQLARMTEIKTKSAAVKARRKSRALATRQIEEEASRLAQEKAERDNEVEHRKQQRMETQQRNRKDRAAAKANRRQEEQARKLEQARREAEKQERDRTRVLRAENRRRDAKEDKSNRQQLREEEKRQRTEKRIQDEIDKKEETLRVQQKKLQDIRDRNASARIVTAFGKQLVNKMNGLANAATPHPERERALANAALDTVQAEAAAQDPRSSMPLHELRKLCRTRTLALAGTPAELVARLHQYDDGRKVGELQADLGARGAHKAGTKAQLVHRLASIDAGLYVHPVPRTAIPAKRERDHGQGDEQDSSKESKVSKKRRNADR